MQARHSSLLLALVAFLAAAPEAPAGDPVQAGDPGVTSPRLIEGAEPAYPEQALGSGIEGRVILRVLVDPLGNVEQVLPLRAPYRGELLRMAAVAAVRHWRYEPARLDGKPVACWLVASLEFYPPDPEAPPPRDRRGRADDRPPEPTPDEEPPPEPEAGAPARPAEASPTPSPTDGTVPAPSPPAPPSPESGPPPPGDSDVRAPAAATPALPSAAGGELDVIELDRGGPAGLILGKPPAPEAVAAAERGESHPTRLRLRTRGVEARLGEDGTVQEIRYVFDDPTGTWEPAPWRTRSGLGTRTACLGVPPAEGRPAERLQETTDEGRAVDGLVYRGDGVEARFRCASGRLVELILRKIRP